MDSINFQTDQTQPSIHFGHFGIVMLAAVLLLGISWMKNPSLFVLHPMAQVADTNVPHYAVYVTPPEDLPQPAVLGANTNQGPSIIQDDGTVVPVDMGQVLGVSTLGVELSLDNIKVNAVADSAQAVQKYFSESQNSETSSISNVDFASALNSGSQEQINQQAQKIIAVRDALQKLPVPQSLVKLQKLKIIQYNSSIALLQNFTMAGQNAEQTNSDMQEFLKSQQDLDAENILVAKKFPQDDPLAALYVSPDGSQTVPQSVIDNFGSGLDLSNSNSANVDQ